MEKFDIILRKISQLDKAYKFEVSRFLMEFRKIPNISEFLITNSDALLSSIPKKYLFTVAKALQGVSKEMDNKLEKRLQDNKIDVAKSLLEKGIKREKAEKEKLLEEYSNTLVIMVDELLESEKVRFIDIEFIGNGAYSDVFQIGSKVIKIGEPRETYKIPNHPRILKPLTRTNFIDDNKKSFACIEISDRVDRLLPENMNEEELYNLYKKLRQSGIIWTDVKFANVGRLKRKNVPSLNGEEVNVAPNSVGFTNEIQDEGLQRGELVVIDTDYIFDEKDSNICWANDGYGEKFEQRYQQELAQEIAGKHLNKVGSTGKISKNVPSI